MEVNEAEWAEMQAKVARLESMVMALGQTIETLRERLGKALENGVNDAENLSKAIDWIKRNQEMLEAVREAVVAKPMPGKPFAN